MRASTFIAIVFLSISIILLNLSILDIKEETNILELRINILSEKLSNFK